MSDTNHPEKSKTTGSSAFLYGLNICLAVILLCLIALPYPWHDLTSEQYRSDCNNADARYRAFVAIAPDQSENNYTRSSYEAEKASLESELIAWCDLAAQHFAASGATSAAKSGFGTFWVSLFGAILLGLTLLYTRRTLHEAEATTRVAIQSSETTKRIGIEQTRAYLTTYANIAKVQDGYRLDMVIKNTGKTPAKKTKCSFSIEASYSNHAMTYSIAGNHFINMILPDIGPDSDWRHGIFIEESEASAFNDETRHRTRICACQGQIVYQTIFGQTEALTFRHDVDQFRGIAEGSLNSSTAENQQCRQ